MRALLLGLGVTAVSSMAVAGEPVQLEGRKLRGQAATGTCGAASIKVTGLDGDWISSRGRIDIKGKTASLQVGSEPHAFMEDRNVVACVASKAGPKVLLLAYCDARECPPSNYYVIDPATTRIETTVEYGECPLACAEEALGARLADHLRDGLSASD
jgi:hypothetical protein